MSKLNIEDIVKTLTNLKETDLAINILETLYKHAHNFEEYDELARVAFFIKKYDKAIKYAKQAIECAPSTEALWVARSNLINLYNHSNMPEQALKLININEKINANDSSTRMEKAFSYFLLNRKDEAEILIRNELERSDLSKEEKTKLRFNLGTYELIKDNLLYGLELFMLEGRKMGLWKGINLGDEQWIGQPADGRDLYVIAEGGIGDEIINFRFIKHLKERNINPIWCTDRKDLANIFRRHGTNVIESMNDLPSEPLWTMSMTLPLFLESTYDSLWYGPYLSPSADYIKKYNYLRKHPGLKVGIRWQGNPEYDQDLHRSILLKDLINCIPENSTIVSLQRDQGIEELKDFPRIIDMSGKMETFDDTLGIIENLDIVITSCTSVAHASCAMNKQTIVLVPILSYYPWCPSLDKTPWYGENTTFFRQQKPRTWDEPITEAKIYIQQLISSNFFEP